MCLQKALVDLRAIWELIGIPEDQRLQRTEVVHKHIKVSSRGLHGGQRVVHTVILQLFLFGLSPVLKL